jgi:O-antigen/teichoic acid export membrane protein
MTAGQVASGSLRTNVAVAFAGNALFAASQWAVLSLIAKLGDNEMLGRYALAVAIVSPLALFSHMNLRAVLATDVEKEHPFGDYVVVRAVTTGLGLATVLAIALAARYPWPVTAVILLVGIVLSADNLSDICYGAMQRRERMDQIACSMAARGLLSVAAMGAALWLTKTLLAGVAAMALARLLILLGHDGPVASKGESLTLSGLRRQATIFRVALPLGVALMMTSLAANMPRYVIEHRLGTAALGSFAAVASFLTVGYTVVNALGQAATPRLALYFSRRETRRFRRLALQLAGMAALLGLAGVAGAALLGHSLLALLYRPAYAAHSELLVWVMTAGILAYTAGIFGFVITSARTFAVQVPLCTVVAAASAVASWMLVPRLGLRGAVASLAVAWLLQIAGELAVLRAALRRREHAC